MPNKARPTLRLTDFKLLNRSMSGLIQSEYLIPNDSCLSLLDALRAQVSIESIDGEIGADEFLVLFEHRLKNHSPMLSFWAERPDRTHREVHLLWIAGEEDFASLVEAAVLHLGGDVVRGALTPQK